MDLEDEDPTPPPTPTPRMLFHPKDKEAYKFGDEIPPTNWTDLTHDDDDLDVDPKLFELVDSSALPVSDSGEIDYLFSTTLKPSAVDRGRCKDGIDKKNYLTNGKIRELIFAKVSKIPGKEFRRHAKEPEPKEILDLDQKYDSLLEAELDGDTIKGPYDEFSKICTGHAKVRITHLEDGGYTIQVIMSGNQESLPILVDVKPRVEVEYYTLDLLTAMQKSLCSPKVSQSLPLANNPYFKARLEQAKRNLNMDAQAGAGTSTPIDLDESQEFIESLIPPPLEFGNESPIARAIRLAHEKEKARQARKLRSNHTIVEVDFSKQDDKKEKIKDKKLKNGFKMNHFVVPDKPKPSKLSVKRSKSPLRPPPQPPKKVRKEEGMTKRQDSSKPKTNKENPIFKKPQIISETSSKRATTEEFIGKPTNKIPKITIKPILQGHGQRETPLIGKVTNQIPKATIKPIPPTYRPPIKGRGQRETPLKFVNGDIMPNRPKKVSETAPNSQQGQPKNPDANTEKILAFYKAAKEKQAQKFSLFKTKPKQAENENKTMEKGSEDNNNNKKPIPIPKGLHIKLQYKRRSEIPAQADMAKDTKSKTNDQKSPEKAHVNMAKDIKSKSNDQKIPEKVQVNIAKYTKSNDTERVVPLPVFTKARPSASAPANEKFQTDISCNYITQSDDSGDSGVGVNLQDLEIGMEIDNDDQTSVEKYADIPSDFIDMELTEDMFL